MKLSITKFILTPILTLVLLATCNTAWAQGTASGPATGHIVDPGPIVVIGDPTNPFPIDLDPNGAPWFKSIDDPNGVIVVPGLLEMKETIINVGTEPWFDWHEHILAPPAGLPQSNWFGVGMLLNGIPLGFTPTGLGTPNLWLDNFSLPVLPGDVLEITKLVEVDPSTAASGGPLLRIQEYPTPEPASAALLGIGSVVLLGKRRLGKHHH